MRQNVILVVLDTARADAFEPYGAPAGATPVVADLAARGAALPHMYAPSNWTMPSHASLFGGALPRALGLSRPPHGKLIRCRPIIESHADRWLPEVLRRSGYDTRAASANRWVSERTGFGLGFEQFLDLRGRRYERIDDERFVARARWAFEALVARVDDGARHATEVLRRWLDEPRSRPFFWFVNLVECHSPYLPPRPYNDLGPLARVKAGEDMRRHMTMMGIWRASIGAATVPEAALHRMRHLYGRAIRLMDDWLGVLLDDLARRRMLDDTLVMVTSDHGENFGEDGLIGHTLSLDNRLIRVPFVAAGPGAPAAGGVRSLAEIPAIVAGAVGLDGHPWVDDPHPHGVAVAQYDTEPDHPKVHEVLKEWGVGADGVRRMTTPLTSLTDGHWKLVRHGDEDDWLFDLHADPAEQRPLAFEDLPATADTAAAERLRTLAGDFGPAATAVPVTPSGAGAADEELAGLEDQMRLLGYL